MGIDIDKKLNFINHITEMSMKVAKSIGLLYKLNHFLPETILKTLYTSLIHTYLSYGIDYTLKKKLWVELTFASSLTGLLSHLGSNICKIQDHSHSDTTPLFTGHGENFQGEKLSI